MKLLAFLARVRCFLPNRLAAARAWLLLALLACRWSTAGAQITPYTDEGTFNAATTSLQGITETYEGLAPAGGTFYGATLPSGYSVSPGIAVADGGYANGNLSLNGSASFFEIGDGVNVIQVVFIANEPQTAFGTDLGSLDPLGSDLVYGSNSPPMLYDYPLTDTIVVTLCQYVGGSPPNFVPVDPVGDPIQFGTVANGFVGATSTTPFQCVLITQVKHDYGALKDSNGYALPNPYNLVLDNTRFKTASTLPMVTAAGSSPDADAATSQPGDFLLTLSAPAATTLTVAYTVAGSAVASTDYQPLSGTVQIPAGQTSALVPVTPLAGATVGRTVTLTLQPGTGYAVGISTPVAVNLLNALFFNAEAALANGVYYLQLPNGNPFGYYSNLSDPRYIYHFDLGYEYVFDANDGQSGVYLYDFASSTFFYTSPSFPFPYLYDFTLNTVLYYYPDPNNPGRYNTNGVRYFYDFAAGKIIVK